MIKKTAQINLIASNLPKEDFEQLPERPGVYYFFMTEHHKVIYISKAVNLKSSIHFTGHKITPQRQTLREIYAITFEVCEHRVDENFVIESVPSHYGPFTIKH
jgi:DNA polymerase-3 subunit epsilon